MPDRPCRARPTGQSMVSEDPAPTSIRDHGTAAGDLKLTPVRAGSARHRNPLVLGGHERSCSAGRIAGHRRSTATTSDAGAALDRVRIPPDGCRGPAALANETSVPGDGLILWSGWYPHWQALRTSSSSAVPLLCHSQQSRPVPSGHPRTMPRLSQPASFVPAAGNGPARTGFASRRSPVRIWWFPPPAMVA